MLPSNTKYLSGSPTEDPHTIGLSSSGLAEFYQAMQENQSKADSGGMRMIPDGCGWWIWLKAEIVVKLAVN